MYSKLRLRVFQASLTRSHGNQLLFLVIRGTHQESLTGLAALTGDLSAGLLDLRLGLAPSLAGEREWGERVGDLVTDLARLRDLL